jgi:hypothetical protein
MGGPVLDVEEEPFTCVFDVLGALIFSFFEPEATTLGLSFAAEGVFFAD